MTQPQACEWQEDSALLVDRAKQSAGSRFSSDYPNLGTGIPKMRDQPRKPVLEVVAVVVVYEDLFQCARIMPLSQPG